MPLASNRARAHESVPVSDGVRGGQKFEEAQQDAAVGHQQGASTQGGSSQTGTTQIEVHPLLPLGNVEGDPELVERFAALCVSSLSGNTLLLTDLY